MAEMNQTQVKYARQRAQEIYNAKKAEIEKEYNQQPKQMSVADKLEALRNGKFEIVEPAILNSYDPWTFNATGIERYIRYTVVKDQPKPDLKKMNERLAELKTAYLSLTDELMLGDNQEALKLLKAFEVG